MPQDISLLFYSIKELYDILKFENKFDKHETSVGAFIVSFHCSLIFSSSMFVLCFVLCFRRIPYSCWSVILSLHFMNLFFYNIVYRSVKLSIQNFPSVRKLIIVVGLYWLFFFCTAKIIILIIGQY